MELQVWQSIVSLVEITIMVIGFVIAIKEYCSTKRNKTKEILVNQIIAYYSEEQEAIKWIEELSSDKIPNIQQKLREKAQNNEHNPDKIYPKMTASQAMAYTFHIKRK